MAVLGCNETTISPRRLIHVKAWTSAALYHRGQLPITRLGKDIPVAKPSPSISDIFEPISSMNVAFSANPALGPHAWHFWQTQELMLDEAQKFWSAWFKRRHEATQSAMRASQKVAAEGASDPAAAMKIMTDWQAHSMERIAEDAKECMELMTRCAGLAANNEVEAMEEAVETTQKATKTSKSKPV